MGADRVPSSADTRIRYSSYWGRVRDSVGGGKMKCVDHLLLLDIYVDSVDVYSLSNFGNSAFVVNMVIQNAHSAERYTKAMSHFLTIVHRKEDVEPVLNAIIRDIYISGRNGAFYRAHNEIHHVRWAINGMRGDTVAQEEVEGIKAKKATSFPCLFDPNCRQYRYSPFEHCLVPMSGSLYTTGSRYMKVMGSATNNFPSDSIFRHISLLFHLDPNDTWVKSNGWSGVVKSFQSLFCSPSLPPPWMPPSLSSKEMKEERRKDVRDAFASVFETDERITEYIKKVAEYFKIQLTDSTDEDPDMVGAMSNESVDSSSGSDDSRDIPRELTVCEDDESTAESTSPDNPDSTVGFLKKNGNPEEICGYEWEIDSEEPSNNDERESADEAPSSQLNGEHCVFC